MGWNGLDLVNDFSAELGDTSSGFKTKVLRWINEGIRDISTSHNWPFLREKGKTILKLGQDTHSIVLKKPSAPDVELTVGGGLTVDANYRVLVTFFESQSGVESIAGEPSETLVPTGSDLIIQLSNIPVSESPLVTARKVYISKNAGLFQYYGIINNNLEATEEVSLDGFGDPILDGEGNPVMIDVPVTFDVTVDSLSALTPPEENSIHMIDGELFIEGTYVLKGTSIQDIIFKSSGVQTNGTPTLWADINQEEVLVYPTPEKDYTASFYYFKLPSRVFGVVSSIPEIPSWLYEDLKNYVTWRGFQFRDRSGQESKKLNYDQGLRTTISRKGKSTKSSGRIRCVTPDSDGMVI